jgi:outer membrane protein OmpA-like peptidoglycan-associated protein
VAAAPATLVPSAPAAPAPAPAAEAPKETQVAALPPGAAKAPTPRQPDVYTISFAVNASEVPSDANPNLKALAARMIKDPALRVELIAYASDPQKSVSRSRRLSTERGVNVRKELLAAGVESTRINLRALGEQSGGGAPDRVDVLLVRR